MSDISISNQRPTVLIVEDDDLVRETLVNVITEGGYKVVQCKTGEHGSQLLADNPDIGLLFTDIFLGGDINGLDLAVSAKAIKPDLAVILTSGFPPAALRAHGVDVNGFDFVQKPCGVKPILALIEKALQSG